ncbi:MAG: hypothetical protein GQ524_07965, partial [Anaerolineales bacterium]|nr:hypothetical protein [Anaerolineales bacterium]
MEPNKNEMISPKGEMKTGGKMEITRDIVLDLLPLYVAGEVSDETKIIVESFLETDTSLVSIVEHATSIGFNDVPIPQSQEDIMEAYKKANKMMVIRTLGLAVVIAGTFLAVLLVVPLLYIFVFLCRRYRRWRV